ncbi:hypothetical protein H310_01317 [Aphanomyces invadans]|uniref:EF-hand domain-containing protein n=1 Tax=Aphanomyces invadans TaxID=157072 RepID=A0A024UQS7_9STRA|nr:hypothetical protein H310_01317 [Aphanomyces invadans]ETW08806.1 hypothetical protein H310_01317 [Aphanomyces invadans]RHY33705.1 hypothetical protein DYB32_004169 [Aphanomyces invadans]|eukprot:XP_008862611.1 hypothetical protein H310_01317 [Aphanomyces invadans]
MPESPSSPVGLIRRDSRLTVDNLLREAFAKVDVDGNGVVNASDIQVGLAKAGVRLSTEDTLALMDKLDRKHVGKVTFDDFHGIHERFIHHIFESFDTHKKGYLDDIMLQEAMQKLGIAVTVAEATSMIKELHPKDPSKITEQDFKYLYLLMRSKMVANPNLEALMWDPDVREFSKQWWKASVEIGEGGLRAPLPSDSTPHKKTVSPTVKFFAGALSGVIEAIVLTPLDVCKTRLQLDKTGKYKGMIDCGKQLVKGEGAKGLYKGFVPWTSHVVLKNGTRFYFNAVYRKLLADKNGQVTGTKEFVAGALAGATEAVLIVTPFEVVKTRLQGQTIIPGEVPKYRGTLQSTLVIIKNEGPFALWKGVAPTIGRQGLNQACSFWSNTFLKKNLWQLKDGETLSPWKSMLTGMLGAIPGPCINCPMDVVKTRMMAQENGKGVAGKYTGLVQATTLIAREEGIKALYKGLVPRLTRLCPSYGIQWLVMDQVCSFFTQ